MFSLTLTEIPEYKQESPQDPFEHFRHNFRELPAAHHRHHYETTTPAKE